MIVVKTKMTEIPNSCKECQYSYRTFGVVLCPLLKEWLEKWQIAEGQKKIKGCPLEQL